MLATAAAMALRLGIAGYLSCIPRGKPREGQHTDWLASGADFDRARFTKLATAIAEGMLGAG